MLDKIKQLRAETGVSFAECKKALTESGGDLEKALGALQKASLKTAEKKSEREVGAGVIDAYLHTNGRVGALVDLRCETDFVAKNPEFKAFAHEIALQVAALNPKYISREDIPESEMKKLEEGFKKEMEGIKKPPEILEKIIIGKMDAVLKEAVLLEQPFIKSDDTTISALVKKMIQKFGENIKIARFARYEV